MIAELPPGWDEEQLLSVVQADNGVGICCACGAEQSNVEPDATGYRCECCGALAVMGAEQLLIEFSGI